MKKFLVLLSVLFLLTSCDSNKEKEDVVEQTVTLTDFVDVDQKKDSTITLMGIEYPKSFLITKGKEQVALYCLETSYKKIWLVDYGTADSIKKLKCQRYNEVLKEIKTLEDLNKPCK